MESSNKFPNIFNHECYSDSDDDLSYNYEPKIIDAPKVNQTKKRNRSPTARDSFLHILFVNTLEYKAKRSNFLAKKIFL